MIAMHVVDVDADDAVAEAVNRLGGFIRGAARKLSHGDDTLANELEQEARIVLWKLDPTRFEPGEDRYLRGAVYRRMCKAVQAELRASGGTRRVSLDVELSDEPGQLPL